jgi:ABC-2 type transport system ATP-binding protein
MTSAVAVQSVGKAYGKVKVLHDVTFECQSGTATALVGPNGAGKSTILRLLCGLSFPTEGQVAINGSRLHDMEPGTVIGSVLDPSAHHPSRSVYSTISIAAKMIGVSHSRVDDVVDMLGLSTVTKRKFRALSPASDSRMPARYN